MPDKHVAFGFGAHYCLGASLAKLEIRVTLGWMVDHVTGVELVGDPQWMPNNRLLGLSSLPVRLLAA